MMPATLIPALESLSALPRQAADEVELFPSFKGGTVTSRGAFGQATCSKAWNAGLMPVHCFAA